MYTYITHPDGSKGIIRDSDGAAIPPDSNEIVEYVNGGGAVAPDPEWTLANVKARKLAEIRTKASSILYAKWPQWLRDNFNIGMDAELKPLYAADVALIRSESGCATPGQESGFEGDVALLTTIDEVLAYTYTFTAI